MSVRRMMLFTLGAKIKNLIEAFKTRVFAAQGEFEAETCLEAQLTDLDNKGLLDSASFVVTPNGYEENLLFAVSPNTSAADLTVTRATTGTRVNADGLIEQVPYNLFQRSEEFDNASWIKSTSTISSNVTTAPNGTLTADRLVENIAVGNSYYIQQSAQGNINTVSIYAKAETRSKLNIFFTAHNSNATFDLIAGTVFSTSGTITASIESVGNGWYRCIASTTLTTHISIRFYLANDAGSVIYNGNGTSGLFIWGAQLVTGTQPRDYFPTTNRFNVPRIDYSNGSCPSILVEPQRTNLVLRSDPNSNEGSTSAGITYQINDWGIGFNNSILFPSNDSSRIRYAGTAPANTTVTFSCYVQMEDGSEPIVTTSNTDPNTDFRIIIGGVAAGVTSSVIRFKNTNIYRVFGSATTGTTSLNNNGLQKSVGNSSKAFKTTGWQLEVGANATSYIPTVASTVTRNADVISKTGVSSLIGQTEGTLFLDFNYNSTPSTANGRLYSIFDTNEGVNSILPMILGFGSANINQFQLAVFSNGVVTTPISPSASTFVPFGRQKFAIAYNSSGYTVFRNGALFASNTGALPSSLSAIEVGCSTLSPTRTLGNSVNSAIIFKTRLTNSQLATLTTL